MYREGTKAQRARVDAAFARVDELEEQLDDDLWYHVPRKLRSELDDLYDQVHVEPRETVDALLEHEALLMGYATLLDQAIGVATRRYHRLPVHFPERFGFGRRYMFPDVYHPAQANLREQIHELIDEHDSRAIVFDRATAYFLERHDPFLVEACVRLDGAPCRLQVVSSMRSTAGKLLAFFVLSALVPASTEPLFIPSERWLSRLGFRSLSKELELAIGDDLPELRHNIRALAELANVEKLGVGGGLATLWWSMGGHNARHNAASAILDAAAALCAIREGA